jgi:hypothetical protein
MRILSRLRHPNVVGLLGGCLAPPNICIVEELMATSLAAYVASRCGHMQGAAGGAGRLAWWPGGSARSACRPASQAPGSTPACSLYVSAALAPCQTRG